MTAEPTWLTVTCRSWELDTNGTLSRASFVDDEGVVLVTGKAPPLTTLRRVRPGQRLRILVSRQDAPGESPPDLYITRVAWPESTCGQDT